jgi:hypothetical protein
MEENVTEELLKKIYDLIPTVEGEENKKDTSWTVPEKPICELDSEY